MVLLVKYMGLLLTTCLNLLHPLHVSIINVDYIQEKNTISVAMKVYKEDIQLLFAHVYEKNIDLNTDSGVAVCRDKLDLYISGRFVVTNEGQKLRMEPSGSRTDDGHIWFMYKIPLGSKPGLLKIENSLFIDLYPDYKSLMIVRYNESEKGYAFDYNVLGHSINFDDY